MDSFKIDLRGSSEDDLKKIDRQYIPKIIEEIGYLAENPFPVQSKKLKDSESSYRLRVGDWRVIYEIEDDRVVVIVLKVAPRGGAYK